MPDPSMDECTMSIIDVFLLLSLFMLTLFFMATVTAVTCSAANHPRLISLYWYIHEDCVWYLPLPTMGSRIKPTKVSLICHCSTTSSMADTRNSAHTATNAVMTRRLWPKWVNLHMRFPCHTYRTIAIQNGICGSSSSSSSSSARAGCSSPCSRAINMDSMVRLVPDRCWYDARRASRGGAKNCFMININDSFPSHGWFMYTYQILVRSKLYR